MHPKWNYAPYYADVKDNTSDQVYVHGSNNSYSRSAWNDIANKAMVTSSGSLFEVHFNATSGSQHSGTMSASGALSQAKSGAAYESILHYYYDSSQYSASVIKIVTH